MCIPFVHNCQIINFKLSSVMYIVSHFKLTDSVICIHNAQDTTEWLLKLRSAERGEPQHILTSQWIIAREAEFVVEVVQKWIKQFEHSCFWQFR